MIKNYVLPQSKELWVSQDSSKNRHWKQDEIRKIINIFNNK
jgi:hypothetical protein